MLKKYTLYFGVQSEEPDMLIKKLPSWTISDLQRPDKKGR